MKINSVVHVYLASKTVSARTRFAFWQEPTCTKPSFNDVAAERL